MTLQTDANLLPAASVRVDTERVATHHPTVAIVGLGYVGLPTALAFVASGARVVGVDADPCRLRAIETGRVDLLDRDRRRLADLDEDQLRLTTDLAEVADGADTVIVCVPTPVDRHRAPDLGPLRAACDEAVACAGPGQRVTKAL